jgi:branched-subunit amino acid transport protein
MAISWLWQRTGFDPRPVHVRFVVDKVALGQTFLRVLRFIHVSIIPQLLQTNLFNNTLIRKTRWQRIENFKM